MKLTVLTTAALSLLAVPAAAFVARPGVLARAPYPKSSISKGQRIVHRAPLATTPRSTAAASGAAPHKPPPTSSLVAGLAFTTAWADIVSMRRYSTYATMLTGSFIGQSKSLALGGYAEMAFFLSVILSYGAGASAFRFIDAKRQGKSNMSRIIALPVLVLLVLADAVSWRDPACRCGALLAAPAFALVNVLSLESASTIRYACCCSSSAVYRAAGPNAFFAFHLAAT